MTITLKMIRDAKTEIKDIIKNDDDWMWPVIFSALTYFEGYVERSK